VVSKIVLMIGQAVEPIEGAVNFDIAEPGPRELVSKFMLVCFGLFFGINVCFEQVHQYVEYIFFHAWSCSLPFRTRKMSSSAVSTGRRTAIRPFRAAPG